MTTETDNYDAPDSVDLSLPVIGYGPLHIPKTRYIRADLVRAAMPANWKEDPAWVALVEALGVEA